MTPPNPALERPAGRLAVPPGHRWPRAAQRQVVIESCLSKVLGET